MSQSAVKASAAATRSSRLHATRPIAPVLAIALAALLSGCANAQRDSIVVGAVPDDYRTNHPIVISEKEQKIDLPVGAGERGMTHTQRAALMGFLDTYDRSAAPVLTIVVPSGSANEIAAKAASRDFYRLAVSSGVRSNRIAVMSYQAGATETSAPIRVAFTSIKAQTDKCGRWPADLSDTTDNKNYANFGCAYQNNLAAQIANPADLIGPRKPSDIDAENRDTVINIYRKREISTEFLGNSEVSY